MQAFTEVEEAFFRAGENLCAVADEPQPWWRRAFRETGWSALHDAPFVAEYVDSSEAYYASYALEELDDVYESYELAPLAN